MTKKAPEAKVESQKPADQANSSEGGAATASTAIPADQADAAGTSSDAGGGPLASDAQQSGAAAGTNSTDDTQQSDQGGAGNAAGPATADALIDAGKQHSAAQKDEVNTFLKDEAGKFRAAFPHLTAAVEAHQAAGNSRPTALRVVAKHDGFRRAGITHSASAIDYPLEDLTHEQLEALFAEPELALQFV